ncbi:Calcium-dependent lipid-binding (CaLB domain) family protein [Abeliophyllum distichum]|uniref:Calcium-dependent lipid-binding (CaLB domain) family protein n=1 Tax=Abeliophyllum distichum TaxID=126358 RepID=A0ABD1RU38_9LAMI
MKFTVEEVPLQQNNLTVDFKLVCERTIGDKDIREVHVPIKELLESSAATAAVGNYEKQYRFVSYQVRKPNSQPATTRVHQKATVALDDPPPPTRRNLISVTIGIIEDCI